MNIFPPTIAQYRSHIGTAQSGTSKACYSREINPNSLQHVFDMSSGNYFFVATRSVDDLSQWGGEVLVKRVVGNVGRADVALLIPPQDPRIRKLQEDTWDLVNHALFDDQSTDSFPHTTHHL